MLSLVLILLGPAAWGPAGCAVASAGGWSAPPVFVVPAAAPRVIDQRPVIDGAAMEAAVERVLARRAAKAAAKVGARIKHGAECVGLCACKKCPDVCQCVKGGGRCGEGCACVVADPVGDLPTGVEWGRIARDTYTKDGRPCSRRDAVRAIEGALSDDSAKPCFTIVGDEPLRKRALADLAASPLAGLVRTQAYPPDHWTVTTRGYKPGLWLTRADGAKLGHLATYDGPESLARLLRKADPNAPPEPAPTPPTPPPTPWKLPDHWPLYAVVALLAVLVLTKK